MGATPEVLKHRKAFVTISDVEVYKRLRVQLHAQGIVLRDEIPGSLIKTKTQQVCKGGDFLVAEIDAKVGGYGIIPASLDGSIVSNHYFLFEIDPVKLDQDFLGYFLRTPAFHRQVTAQGSTNYAAIRPGHVLSYEIPSPPISEQRRIVALIKAIEDKAKEATKLRGELKNEIDSLYRSILKSDTNPRLKPLNVLVRLREPDVIVRADEMYHFAGVYSFGRGIFKGQMKSGMEFAYSRLTRIRTGDFVYPKLMAWEGALGVVPANCDGLVVSTEFPVFEVIKEEILPEVLDVYFRDPAVWPALSGASTGTNVRRRRLNPADFLRYEFPVPARSVQQLLQRTIVETTQLRALQEETRNQINALMPAVLSCAFTGCVN